MWNRLELSGKRFGKLTVIKYSHTYNSKAYWLCLCDCGKQTTLNTSALKSGNTKSCGCLHAEIMTRIKTTHGLSKTAVYKKYLHMIERCYNTTDKNYHNYGGRGIVVCARWLGQGGFSRFIEDMKIPESGLELDRINVNGNYEPENCRWVNHKEQCYNKRSNIHVTVFDITSVLKNICSILGMDYKTVHMRYKLGWPMTAALFATSRKLSTKDMLQRKSLNALKF